MHCWHHLAVYAINLAVCQAWACCSLGGNSRGKGSWCACTPSLASTKVFKQHRLLGSESSELPSRCICGQETLTWRQAWVMSDQVPPWALLTML